MRSSEITQVELDAVDFGSFIQGNRILNSKTERRARAHKRKKKVKKQDWN